MKSIKIFVSFYVVVVFLCSCNNSTQLKQNSSTTQQTPSPRSAASKVFQCPMHPHIIKDEAGNCTICGMELEQKTYHEALMFLSDFKKENPDYKEGDELLKDSEQHPN